MKLKLLFLYFLIFLGISLSAQNNERIQFHWDSIASLENTRGINGAFTGIHNNVFIIAGGANFADAPVWEGGKKTWYDNIEVLKNSATGYIWVENIKKKLPRPLAYGASVTTSDGVLCIGGNNLNGTYSDVFLIKWNDKTQNIEIEEKPSLPIPLANFQATSIGDEVFVVGGQEHEGGLAKKTFFSFKNGTWTKLPDLPGQGRIQPVVVSQNNGKTNCVYVFSGTHFDPEAKDPNQFLDDVYEYNPLQKKWYKNLQFLLTILLA
jgi:solute:Na+ symporter, SSS family